MAIPLLTLGGDTVFQVTKKPNSQKAWAECINEFPIYDKYDLTRQILDIKKTPTDDGEFMISYKDVLPEDERYIITNAKTDNHSAIELISTVGTVEEYFNPSKKKEFITALKRLKLPDKLDKIAKGKLLKYCSKYGIPIASTKDSRAYDDMQRIPIYILWKQIVEFQEMTRLWGALNDCNNIAQLIALYAKKLDDFKYDQYDFVAEGVSKTTAKKLISAQRQTSEYALWYEVKDETSQIKARQYLCYLITQRIKGVNYEYIPRKGSLVPTISVESPLQYAWYDFAKLVFNNVKPSLCLYCKEPFAPTREGQLFCPADNEENYSVCKHNYNSRILRQRETIGSKLKEGKSISEIATDLRFNEDYLRKRIALWEKPKEGV